MQACRPRFIRSCMALNYNKKDPAPKGTKSYSRYHPDSCMCRHLVLRNVQWTLFLTQSKGLQKYSFGGKLKSYLNLKNLTAGGFFSLKENNFLNTPSMLLVLWILTYQLF